MSGVSSSIARKLNMHRRELKQINKTLRRKRRGPLGELHDTILRNRAAWLRGQIIMLVTRALTDE